MKIEAVDRAGMKMIGETGFTFLQHTLNYILVVFKYSFLFILLFLLASHESANPKKGNTTFEFYSSEFRDAFLRNIDPINENGSNNIKESTLMIRFYQERQFLPVWTNNFEITASFTELMELIKNSYQYGLLPSSYNYRLLTKLENRLDEQLTDEQKIGIRVQLEKTATQSAIRFMNHLAAGIRLQDTTKSYSTFLNTLPLYLNNQLTNNNLRDGILDLQPKNRQYTRLQRAASKYITTAMPDTIEYTAEDLTKNQIIIAEKLAGRGFLDQSFINDTSAIRTALRNYQKAHGFEGNGIIDENTLQSLTHNIKDEFYTIAINLDRLRKDELENEDCILINIPEFKLHYYDNHGYGKDFNVIVGAKETPTPMLTSQIEWVIANPYWNVPVSISRNEIIPLIKKDSTYLEKHGFSVVDNNLNAIDPSTIDWSSMNPKDFTYWFRQNNDNNALGVIKFLFPNPHSVYLHDTQAKNLFSKRIRAFSHGCIRLQNPEDLAQIIVSTYREIEKKEDIQTIIQRKNHKEIKIDKPLPIYVRYYSCTADSTGNLFFHPDIYSIDDLAISELFGNSSWQ